MKPVSPPSKPKAQLMYRGVAFEDPRVTGELQTAADRPSVALVYRGTIIDPVISHDYAILEQQARIDSTAKLMYRGIPLERPLADSIDSRRSGSINRVGQ